MSDIKPFEFRVSDEDLDFLKKKLALTRFPSELEDPGNAYGARLPEVKRLAKAWQEDTVPWRKIEESINHLPNFQTTVQPDGFEELNIHFLHAKSEVPGAIPLLFCHGWPGCFLEARRLLEPLSQAGEDNPAFHVIAPSLPNFGFSDGTSKKGFGLKQYAETLHKLMLKLGYDEYVTQGGDWGFFITRIMGVMYPDHVKGSHINFAIASEPSFGTQPLLALQHAVSPYTEKEKAGLARTKWFETEGSGYNQQQRTKPQTLGYALSDSPAGLLAWIYEKLVDWSDDYPWSDAEILAFVGIYWYSKAGPEASLRIYYESGHVGENGFSRKRATEWVDKVKLGVALFPRELYRLPNLWSKTLGPLVYVSDNDKGGHFAATESSDVIINDLRKMFGKKGGAYGVVEGKDGYVKESTL
ncbi:hypothetical protein MMC25_000267 [Agyrium rufum]|nr:hypothetical protein [Agyrium rufum]